MRFGEWAKAQRLGNQGAQALLELLADLCDDQGHLSAKHEELAELLGVSRRTIVRHFQRLDESGLVHRYDLFTERGKPRGQAIFLLDQVTPSDNQVTPSDNQVTTGTNMFFNNTHTRARTRVEDIQLPLHVEREAYHLYLDTLAELGRVPSSGQIQAHMNALTRIAASGVDPNEAILLATQKGWDGFDAQKLIRMLGKKSSAPRRAPAAEPEPSAVRGTTPAAEVFAKQAEQDAVDDARPVDLEGAAQGLLKLLGNVRAKLKHAPPGEERDKLELLQKRYQAQLAKLRPSPADPPESQADPTPNCDQAGSQAAGQVTGHAAGQALTPATPTQARASPEPVEARASPEPAERRAPAATRARDGPRQGALWGAV